MSGLFRKEALEATGSKYLGTIVIGRMPWLNTISILLVVFVIVTALIIAFASYTRKISVFGSLKPVNGELKIIAPIDGLITDVLVAENGRLQPQQVLVRISNERLAKEPVQKAIAMSLENKINSLSYLDELSNENNKNEIESLNNSKTDLIKSLSFLIEKKKIQEKRYSILKELYFKQEELKNSGFISGFGLQQKEFELVEQESIVIESKRLILEKENEIKNISSKIESMKISKNKNNEDGKIEINSVKSELIRTEAEQAISITSPIAGELVSLLIRQGQFIKGGQTIASIYPENDLLEAILYVPSNAIGFIKAGSAVNLKYDAFPYQKFGSQNATVKSVSKVAIQSEGLSNKGNLDSMYYKVIVNLPKQGIETYGKNSEFKSGMTVQADIFVEQRKIYEWILEPLYSMK